MHSVQLNTNVAALNAQRQLYQSSQSLGLRFQRLSSGYKINSAKDDAAGLQISNRLSAQVGGLAQAMRNANDGLSMLQTAEGSLQEVTNAILRMRDLAVQSANGSNGPQEREALQKEVTALQQEINRINDTTRFGGKSLFSPAGASSSATFAQRVVVMGLKAVWLPEAENRVRDYYGIVGDGATITVDLNDPSSDGAGGVLASVSYTGLDGNGHTTGMELNVDMADFVPPNLPDGGSSPFFNDRIIGHEMVHAIMGRATNFTPGALPNWFIEGTAEFIHGADERVAGDTANGTNTAAVMAAFAADDVSASAGYSAGYSAVRYLHEQIQAAGGNGIKDLMVYMNANPGSNLSTALANASSGAYANLAAFEADFTANGAAFIGTFNFANEDTGAIGGLDVDGGAVYTAKSVFPNVGDGNGVSDQPMDGFNVVFPTLGSDSLGGEIVSFQVGANRFETIDAGFGGVSTTSLGLTDLDLINAPQFAVMFLDDALTQVDSQRAKMGAVMNRLQSTIANLGNTRENAETSRSRIRDADFAVETAELARSQILQQFGLAIAQQANLSSNGVLQLLGA
ncbi:flagellinolysin [Permianibacter sp. IMCC34836]|uniref:flagellinolysin n=1 Tax=Permianibacter fluminis TaxID=2738515 RepID=UPI001552ADDB|nr:flagellinolysin [Permianibacter fluminis]NQD38242.1 flagellinolysin [Permianibacter fluminis]